MCVFPTPELWIRLSLQAQGPLDVTGSSCEQLCAPSSSPWLTCTSLICSDGMSQQSRTCSRVVVEQVVLQKGGASRFWFRLRPEIWVVAEYEKLITWWDHLLTFTVISWYQCKENLKFGFDWFGFNWNGSAHVFWNVLDKAVENMWVKSQWMKICAFLSLLQYLDYPFTLVGLIAWPVIHWGFMGPS
jgi:hypothetical protein